MKWIYNPIKVFAVVFGLVGLIFLMTSCLEPNREFEQAQETKEAIQVVNHNEKQIIIETLHNDFLVSGIYKITIDSNNTFVVISNYDALAIERLE